MSLSSPFSNSNVERGVAGSWCEGIDLERSEGSGRSIKWSHHGEVIPPCGSSPY
uniref:Uncharacterized protein n=1 Tax=Arundo donax TaxID=35708 RepID=A0A0A9HUL8_ARUDO